MKTLFIDGGRKRGTSLHPSPSPTVASVSSLLIESATETHRKLYRSHTLRLNKPQQLPNPLPYLDVLSLQSRRLVSQTREQIAAHEALTLKKYPQRQAIHGDDNEIAVQQKLEDLLESVHLLLEPIQIPDLSHTGVFDTSTSQLQAQAAEFVTSTATTGDLKLSLSSVDKESEVKLFYPTGAKKVNMREYIKVTIQRHLVSQSYADLPHAASPSFEIADGQHDAQSPAVKKLMTSASKPVFTSQNLSSPPSKNLQNGPKPSLKKASKASPPSPAKQKKPKFASNSRSPQKSTTSSSACGNPLLNSELTRQAKDIIAAIRANSSKINELMNSK